MMMTSPVHVQISAVSCQPAEGIQPTIISRLTYLFTYYVCRFCVVSFQLARHGCRTPLCSVLLFFFIQFYCSTYFYPIFCIGRCMEGLDYAFILFAIAQQYFYVIYTSRAYAMMSVSVCLSVCPFVCDGSADHLAPCQPVLGSLVGSWQTPPSFVIRRTYVSKRIAGLQFRYRKIKRE